MEHPPAALAPALPLQPQTPGVWKDCHARRTKARPATPRPIPPVAEARACYEFSAAMAAAGAPLSRGSDSSPLPKVKTSTAPSTKPRSEEHTSELQSLMRISYAVFFFKKKTSINHQ